MAITAENMMIDSSLDVGNAEDGMNWTDAECTTEVGEVGEEVVWSNGFGLEVAVY